MGVGNAIDSKLAKMMLILKLHNLSFGYSGIREETLERMLFFVDQDMIPVVPEKGSVGASGDLAPLAHLFLPLIGLGKFDWKGERVSADLAYMQLGMTPLKLQAKEGLALINGTQFIAAHAAWAVYRMYHYLDVADIIGAMSLEGVLGSASPFKKQLHDIRPFDGCKLVAHRMRTLLNGSEMLQSHAECGRGARSLFHSLYSAGARDFPKCLEAC